MSKNINMSVDQDGIAIIEIDVQDRPMNVITVDFADDFKNCICLLYTSPSPRDS